jgi:hypothetical protein
MQAAAATALLSAPPSVSQIASATACFLPLVHVTPSQPCFVTITNKTPSGFNVVLTPLSTVTLVAGTFDVTVIA